ALGARGAGAVADLTHAESDQGRSLMKIIKATEPITVEHPVFLIFGQPGICKSSLGYSTKDGFTVDTVGRCLDVMIAHLASADPKKFPGGNPSQQGWGQLKNTFRTWMSNLR